MRKGERILLELTCVRTVEFFSCFVMFIFHHTHFWVTDSYITRMETLLKLVLRSEMRRMSEAHSRNHLQVARRSLHTA